MKLIKRTDRKVSSVRNYSGVCHQCNSPIEFEHEMIVVEIENTDDYWRVVPVDIFECPHCGEKIITMMVFKSLEVSKELKPCETLS